MDIRDPGKISPSNSDHRGSTEAAVAAGRDIDAAILPVEADPTMLGRRHHHHYHLAMPSISWRSFTTCQFMSPEVFPFHEINSQMECSSSGPPMYGMSSIRLGGQTLQGFLNTATDCSSPSDGKTRQKVSDSSESFCCRNAGLCGSVQPESSGKTDTMCINGSTSSQKIKRAETRNTVSDSLDMNGARSSFAETGSHGFKEKSSTPKRENHDINNLVDNPEGEEHPSNKLAKRRMDDGSLHPLLGSGAASCTGQIRTPHMTGFLDGSNDSKKQAELPRCGDDQGLSFAVEESSWIRRWRCKRVKAAASTESRLARTGLLERENCEVPVRKHKGKDLPSAAAMALMVKVARSYQPLEFQRRGQLVEWNIK